MIVTSLSVPVRGEARTSATTLSRVRLGTVLNVTERGSAWNRVEYVSGGRKVTGWIPAVSLGELTSGDRGQVYLQIVERNYRNELDFAAASEVYEFMSSVSGELDQSDSSAEFELRRLLVLKTALRAIPFESQSRSPYREFLKSQEPSIVYNEPAGQWIVASDQFWGLHSKYQKSVVSDRIAWEAALNPLPGECEGYVNCHLFDLRMRFGEYLNLHPNGKNAGEALTTITDYLEPIVADSGQKTVYTGPVDVTDRAEFNNLVAELRTIVARLGLVEKERTLQQLRQIAEAYR